MSTIHVPVPFLNSSIQTLVTNKASEVEDWLEETMMEMHSIVGLGVKWRHPFGSQQQFDVATVQLCVGRRCLIFQFHNADDPVHPLPLLSSFLNTKNLKVVGFGMEKILNKLEYDCHLTVTHAIDLGIFAAEKYGKPKWSNGGMAELVTELLGGNIPSQRKVRRSRWERAELSYDQVSHASLEVFLGCRLMEFLISDD
jgi:ribonuclease D